MDEIARGIFEDARHRAETQFKNQQTEIERLRGYIQNIAILADNPYTTENKLRDSILDFAKLAGVLPEVPYDDGC